MALPMRSLLLMLLCLMAVAARAENAPAPASADVRILIDVSGSMKRTDPLNLRVPALKLLISLLPADAQASLWLFAESPQPLLALGKTDKDWKTRALGGAGKIHSRGQFTNIEAALEQASADWKNASALNGKRHIILLTDGMVDVSKDAQKNAASRQRIIAETIPRLQQLGVQLHTIALSDEADMELLKQLSQDTGGWHEAIQAADQLERMFAKLVTQTTPHDSVPLQGNAFNVDASIQEFSVLVFLSPGAEPTRLVRPDQIEASEIMLQPNMHWRHEQGYDLITVDHPQPGEWRLIAKTDADNRVMVVTDLKLMVKELPNYLSKGEALPIAAHFTDQEGDVTKEDFLKLISLRAKRQGGEELELTTDASKPGYFKTAISDLPPGKHSLSITADGKTFKREVHHNLEVVEQLVSSQASADTSANPPQLVVNFTANAAVLDVKSTRIVAKLSNAYGQSTEMPVPGVGDGWVLKLPLPSPQELLTINFTVTAKTLQGKDIRPSVPPLVLNSQTLAQLMAPAAAKTAEPEPAKAEAQPAQAAPATPDTAAENPAAPNWTITLAAALGVNLVLIGGGWYGYRTYQRRASAKQASLLNELVPFDPNNQAGGK